MNLSHYGTTIGLLCVLWSANRLQADDLGQQVRSLLSNRCFACHGPDASHREGGFRLDQAESYLVAADSGEAPIVPGKPEQSSLLSRVSTDDVDLRMPPPHFAAALTASEKELLRKWIASGADLPRHWSFLAPNRPSIPEIEGAVQGHSTNWTHPIDRFVLKAMRQRGFQPSIEAKRHELLRRVSLDLVGLPPTPAELAAFASDTSPDAYEKQVERLLASPAFGEHWARKWLDLARYADSAGYADDPDRTIWAYRDWVIRAINANMPIDQFTIEQIAGDLLPNSTTDQLTATAFHRNTLTNSEGGTNDEEFRNVAIVDRVNTTMAVWMGLTMSCAQCHTHKYDPLSQEEYFKVFAIFNQSQDADRRDEGPTIPLFSDAQQQQLNGWQARVKEIDAKLSMPADHAELAAWEAAIQQPQWKRLTPIKYHSSSPSDSVLSEDGIVSVKPQSPAALDAQTIEFQLPDTTQPIQSIAIRTIPAASLARGGAGLGNGNFVLSNVQAELLPKPGSIPLTKFVRVELPGKEKILSLAEVQVFSGDTNIALKGKASQSSTAFEGDAARAIDANTNGIYAEANSTTHTATESSPWWEVELPEQAQIDKLVIWNRTDNGIHTRLDGCELVCLDHERKEVFRQVIKKAPMESQSVEVNPATKVRFSSAYAAYSQSGFGAATVIDEDTKSGWAVDGQVDQSHLLSLIPDKPIDASRSGSLKIVLDHKAPYPDHVLASFAVEVSFEPSIRDWVALSDEARKVHQISVAERTDQQQRSLAVFFAKNFAGSTASLRAELSKLQDMIAKVKPDTSVPVMRELDLAARRKTKIQLRGDYKSLGQEVEPGTPAVFHPIEASSGDQPNRLDLARWLVDRKNPLTARVWVNRMWEALFGLGIVRTSEEFGTQGELPTHPELLDWLAVELVESGWDFKSMMRTLVASQTYRQTSMVSSELLSQDRDNIWLARGPRVRLSAETIRDQALLSAGLLTGSMFGAPVQPPQPNLGLSAAFGSTTDWTTSQGEDRYRRAVYTKWRRSNPYPAMSTFDAPSREVCVLRRDVTNTPLQALVTLNDPVFIEAAQGLARRIVLYEALPQNDADRLRAALEYVVARPPTPAEADALLALLDEGRQYLKDKQEDATKLATDPLGPLPAGANAVDLAAWTAVCNVIMNLDEALMKR
jgi:Protein of unknown function (DUF1553)/Protein of unknown function (DUF1549)/Planctomycete cytochrome C